MPRLYWIEVAGLDPCRFPRTGLRNKISCRATRKLSNPPDLRRWLREMRRISIEFDALDTVHDQLPSLVRPLRAERIRVGSDNEKGL